MPYPKKLKKENKELIVENSNLRLALLSRTKLLIKHDLLPKIAITDCLCKGTTPPCARCAARDILIEAGFQLKEEKPKSNIIVPDGIVTPNS